MSSSAARAAIRKLNTIHQAAVEFNETHPPVTRLMPAQADSTRQFTFVGDRCVMCSLPCHGPNIPPEYNRTKTIVNVFDFGIKVPDYESSTFGESAYYGVTCRFHPEKVCVVGDQRLLRAIER